MDLRAKIQQLATHFASSVLEVIRQTSLEELLGERGLPPAGAVAGARALAAGPKAARAAKSSARLARRSPADIAATVASIVSLLKKHKGGLRAEQIREQLGLEAKELPRPLAEGVKGRAFKKKGQKRATTYFIA
jgi:hypothetical protein